MARPWWILLGGCSLAFLAAALNAAFMLRIGMSVSHLTGDLARFAMDLTVVGRESGAALVHLLAALSGFVLGAMGAGFFIHHPRLEFTRPYGRSITCIGALLILAHGLLGPLPALAVLLAAAACGLQNALATHFRGVILRTTHVTGLLTDLGVLLGMRLRGYDVESWKIAVPLALVLAFSLGAAAGALLVLQADGRAVLVLGCAYLLGGLGWTVVKHRILKLGQDVPPAESR